MNRHQTINHDLPDTVGFDKIRDGIHSGRFDIIPTKEIESNHWAGGNSYQIREGDSVIGYINSIAYTRLNLDGSLSDEEVAELDIAAEEKLRNAEYQLYGITPSMWQNRKFSL